MTSSGSRTPSAPLLEIRDLEVSYRSAEGEEVVLDGMSLRVDAGETLGLVGESGSGKSTAALAVLGLLPPEARIDGGEVAWLGQELVRLPEPDLRALRGGDIGLVFQEPATTLNPVLPIGEQVAETLRVRRGLSRSEARARARERLSEVGLAEPGLDLAYPHELSGGQRQRVTIALALACDPKLLIADEPTTALDVTVQRQILDLLRRLRDERGMAMLFVSHDLGVIAEVADRVVVLLDGQVVESGSVSEVLESPRHPYTRALLACRPRLGSGWRRLPTAGDFLELGEGEDGEIEVFEKPVDAAALDRLRSRGRGPLLHPVPRLEELGYEAPSGVDTIGEDVAPLLVVEGLTVTYALRSRRASGSPRELRAIDGVSFEVFPGQTLGLVGESGCGKTTTALAILRLCPIAEGSVGFDGVSLTDLGGEALRRFRSRMQIVLQDPQASLDPRQRVGSALVEAMSIHRLGVDRAEREERARELLQEVRLRPELFDRYPHQLSTGQRQRVSVARALAVEPELLVLDEAVSALDVSVQAQVLDLLKELQEDRGLTYLFVSHDLAVVELMSDMIAVMEQGRVVELGPASAVCSAPRAAATRRLIESVPGRSAVEGT